MSLRTELKFPQIPFRSWSVTKRALALTSILLWQGVAIAHAEEPMPTDARRGMITSSTCPLTCADLRVPKADCVERNDGFNCSVEDLRQPPGAQTMIRLPAATVATNSVRGGGSVAPATSDPRVTNGEGTLLTVPR